MVLSQLKTSINYDEEQHIEEQDKGISADTFNLQCFHKSVQVVIGKANLKYSHRGLLYYSIYAIVKNKIRTRLGIIEVPAKKYKVFDVENKTPDFTLYEPIFFKFVDTQFINRLAPVEIDTPNNDDPTEEMFEIAPTTTANTTNVKEDTIIKADRATDIFTQVGNTLPLLQEESETVAKKIRKKYIEEPTHNWIQQFMKNPNYEIEFNSGRGDCFFYVIIQAFNQLGKETTVQKLRDLLSKEITKDVFEQNKKLYDDIVANQQQNLTKIKEQTELKKKADGILKTYTAELATLSSKEAQTNYVKKNKKILKEQMDIKENAVKIIDELKAEIENNKQVEDLIDTNIKRITTLEEYRDYIKTSNYWADTWAISTFEWLLNVKFIILNSANYPDSVHQIIECGEKNRNIGTVFRPTHYIITTYNGEHYELVMYKNKAIFEYKEIPYDIRVLITNKCLEKNAGIFNSIEEFRDFQSRIGIDPSKNDSLEIKENYDGLYDNTVIFMFYGKSSSTPKPGKGSGESIPITRVKDFIPLSKFEDWRRKLDDTWMDTDTPIILDNKKWASVSHYMFAIPFKDIFPEKYMLYSLNSSNKIAKSHELAKKTSAKEATEYKDKLEPFMAKNYTIERENALRAKFVNPDLKNILIATKNATLLHFENKNAPKEDKLLMFLRKEFTK